MQITDLSPFHGKITFKDNKYKLHEDIKWPYTDDYYFLLTNGMIFDGNNKTITFKNDNKGIFQINSTFRNVPLIKDLTIKSTINMFNGGGFIRPYNENFKINYPKYNLNTINAFTYYKTASC